MKIACIRRVLSRHLPRPVAVGAWLAMLTFAVLTCLTFTGGSRIVAGDTNNTATESNPAELSPHDRELYTMIFAADARGQFTTADQLIAQLYNLRLIGHVLATRYLDSSYQASNAELTQWLAHYGDHPAAGDIAHMVVRRGLDVTLPPASKPLRGEGSSDHMGKSSMPDLWFSALGKWRDGNFAQAKSIFNALSVDDTLSDWNRASAYYWSYRAGEKLGDHAQALAYLKNAAEYTTTFYGLLASQQLGILNISAAAPEVSDSLRYSPGAIRAALLVQLGHNDDAEAELRALYGVTGINSRGGIVTIASELGLPNLQMRLARTDGLSQRESRFAQYPIPPYMVDLHTVMDSALLLAVARNESGFRDMAQSSAGAVGMMQMLPSTARTLERRLGTNLLQVASNESGNSDESVIRRLSDPAMSARYGAQYLKLLAQLPAINSNMIHLLIGYNAGPGTVISWKATAGNLSDPLLYIESIPYAETRNYTMQVCAQYWIYQLMMNKQPTTLAALANGQWPMLKRPL